MKLLILSIFAYTASHQTDTTIHSNGDPVITHEYTADPVAMVYNGTVYLYTGHDEAPARKETYMMHNWLCFSSTDMVTWMAA